MTIRLAIAGLGKIARDQHLAAIAANADFVLAATVDPIAAPIDGVPHFASLDALLASDVQVEAVAVCTPPQQRYAVAVQALEAGKHVMVEKPPCATVAQAEALAALATEHGVTLYTAWHSRHAAGVEAARAWLADKALQSVHIVWKEDVRVWHPGQAWIFAPGGFGVFDPAINALSIATEILPRALRVESAVLDIPENAAMPIAGTVALKGADGVPVSLEMDFLQTGQQSWDIVIETDADRLQLSLGGSVLVTPEGETTGPDAEYPALYARFAQLVHGRESEVDLAPLELVEAALDCGERRMVAPFIE
ncbi:MAG TPA: Gfo/Idh/MocA family oxidoreductase [Erythrobacter sp.]|nr:Gfo/Idh/MocA family oxidoreductase [Erythrobacter sp.]